MTIYSADMSPEELALFHRAVRALLPAEQYERLRAEVQRMKHAPEARRERLVGSAVPTRGNAAGPRGRR